MKVYLLAMAWVLAMISMPFSTFSQVSELASRKEAPSIKINLNKADADSLVKSVKGIGIKRAEAIVKYRQMHGPFKSVEELAEVKGIGKQFVKKNLIPLQAKFSVN